MTKIKLRFVQEFRDRHGRIRRYFRRKGCPSVRLTGEPGSKEFNDQYEAALAARFSDTPKDPEGSIGALIVAFYRSPKFTRLRPVTQASYRWILERLRRDHGTKPVARLERRHVQKMIDDRASTPTAANSLLTLLRILMGFAVRAGVRQDDPTIHVDRIDYKSDGHHSWTEEEIAAFEAHWPIGSRERLAFSLLLYTGQRVADVVRMGRQHIRGGEMTLAQQKTGIEVTIPLHPVLMAQLPTDRLIFLLTQYGKPYTPGGFSNWLSDACDAAGLPQCAAHGLRKAASRRLAESGCTVHEIAAITGHQSLREVERYTKAANRKRLARSAMSRAKGEG